MRCKNETSRAFLLRSIDHSESNSIVTLLTLKWGKISALARGARKSRRRFGGALEPFSLIEVEIEFRDTRLCLLKEARPLVAHMALASNLNRIDAAASIFELIREMSPKNEPLPRSFALIEEVLPLLSRIDGNGLRVLTIATELKLLAFAGMAPGVQQCNTCRRVVPKGKKALFHPARGGVVCTSCGGGPIILSYNAVVAFHALSTQPLSSVKEIELTSEELAEIDRALSSFMEHHIERPMNRRKLV